MQFVLPAYVAKRRASRVRVRLFRFRDAHNPRTRGAPRLTVASTLFSFLSLFFFLAFCFCWHCSDPLNVYSQATMLNKSTIQPSLAMFLPDSEETLRSALAMTPWVQFETPVR